MNISGQLQALGLAEFQGRQHCGIDVPFTSSFFNFFFMGCYSGRSEHFPHPLGIGPTWRSATTQHKNRSAPTMAMDG